MTAPAATERTDPVGYRLEDGHGTIYAFADDPDVSIWEVEATPPGVDGGDPINTTTFHNSTYVTKAAQHLQEITDAAMRVGYDPTCWSQIIALINNEGAITAHFPNGDKLAFYGYLRSFKPSSNQKGKFPDAEAVIVVTNVDPATGDEEGPVFTAASGTGSGL